MTDPKRLGEIEPRATVSNEREQFGPRRLADVARLLQIAAKFDNRSWNEATVKAWAYALDGLDYARCEAAILKHYRETDKWLMPGAHPALAKTTTGTGTACPTCNEDHRPSQPCPARVLGGNSDGMWRRALEASRPAIEAPKSATEDAA